jgi:hypothetical protein
MGPTHCVPAATGSDGIAAMTSVHEEEDGVLGKRVRKSQMPLCNDGDDSDASDDDDDGDDYCRI